MADVPDVEFDRRKTREKGLITHIVETFNGKQGRKAAFAIWGFWIANGLIVAGKITETTWWYVFLTCALLLGFGTTLDAVVTKLGDAVAVFVGDKVATILGKTNAPPTPTPPPTQP